LGFGGCSGCRGWRGGVGIGGWGWGRWIGILRLRDRLYGGDRRCRWIEALILREEKWILDSNSIVASIAES